MRILNAQVFNKLFQKWYQALTHFAFNYLRDSSLAEDLVQDVFAALWASRESINIENDPRNYLFASVRNACIAYLKKEEKNKEIVEQLKVQMNEKEWMVEEMENIQLKLRLKNAIDQLPAKTQKVFILHKKEGLSFEEIASYLDKSIKTVEKQVARAYQILREELNS